MGSKVDEVGPKPTRRLFFRACVAMVELQGPNAAVRQPTRRLFFRACVAMVELQGHWGERFGGVFVFWGGCWVDSCSAAGPLGRAFWRCIFGWLLARPKLYHYGRRRWPQDGSNAAVRQPTRRLFSRVHGYG